MKPLYRNVLITLFLFFSSTCLAVSVSGAKVVSLYVQSVNGLHDSSAHAVLLDQKIDSSCNGKLYIEKEDTALFSTLLAYKLAGVRFNALYSVGDPAKFVKGHFMPMCKLFSVY